MAANNTLLTPQMITREALRILHNNLVFVKGINRQYSSEFAVSGAKIGASINVRKPVTYYVRDGQTMQTQSTVESYVPLTLNHQWGTDISFSSQERTLSLDDFSKRVLAPAMARIASAIDYAGLQLTKNVFCQVGTPGTSPGSGNSVSTILNPSGVYPILNAGMMMDMNACPRDENRKIAWHPAAMASITGSLSGLFQAQEQISEQYKRGVLGTALGFEHAIDQNVATIQCGSRGGNAVVAGANQTGANLVTSGWTANTTLNAGEIIDILNVNGVNPENQQAWNIPMTAGHGNIYFVVTANSQADANGNMTIPIYPPIVAVGANIANGTVSALPANGAAVNVSGAANTSYPISLAYHEDAFTLATADLVMPEGVDFAARETYDGISLRIVRMYDIANDLFPCRIDVLGGWAALRPELAVRITG